jgi:lipopolysaccharide export LptBFGC system permease protein LptF
MKKKKIKNFIILISICMAIFVVFIVILFIWRKWAISQSIEVTVKITDQWSSGDPYTDRSWQYSYEYYDSPLPYEEVLNFFDLKGTKTELSGFVIGTFHSNKKYKTGDLVDGYLRESGNHYDFIPKN